MKKYLTIGALTATAVGLNIAGNDANAEQVQIKTSSEILNSQLTEAVFTGNIKTDLLDESHLDKLHEESIDGNKGVTAVVMSENNSNFQSYNDSIKEVNLTERFEELQKKMEKLEAEEKAKAEANARAEKVALQAQTENTNYKSQVQTQAQVQTQVASTPPTSTKGEAIINAAMSQIGVGQDCTMLVTNSLRAVGINFHSWPAGYLGLGTQVSYEDARPGDLIYYPNGGMGVPHIAVYAGNGQAVHGGWQGGQTVLTTAFVGYGATFIRVH